MVLKTALVIDYGQCVDKEGTRLQAIAIRVSLPAVGRLILSFRVCGSAGAHT